MYSTADLKPIRMQLPTSHDDRAIDWATRMHRTKVRSTTVGSKSKHAGVLRHAFVSTNADVDAKLDAPASPMAAKRRRGKGKVRMHLRDLAYV